MGNAQSIAVLCHEFAHFKHRDTLMGGVVGGALMTRTNWIEMADSIAASSVIRGSLIAVFQLLMKLLATVLAGLLGLLYHGLLQLFFRARQRAEFRADLSAAGIVGSGPMIGALVSTEHAANFDRIRMRQRKRVAEGMPTMYDAFRKFAREVPAAEAARLRRSALREWRRIQTHPPTAHRIAVLEAHPALASEVPVPAAHVDAMMRELREFETELHNNWVENLPAALTA